MLRKTLGLAHAHLLPLVVAIALMASGGARAGEHEDWCFADQEKTPEEALAGCTALIEGGKLSQDKLATAYANRCLVHTQRKASDLAIADCTQAIAIEPGNALAYAQRGEALAGKATSSVALPTSTRPCASTPATHHSRSCAVWRAPTQGIRTAPSPT